MKYSLIKLFFALSSILLGACNPPTALPPDSNAKLPETTISPLRNSSVLKLQAKGLSAERLADPKLITKKRPALGLEEFSVFEVHRGEISGLSMSEDGKKVYSAGNDGKVRLNKLTDLMSIESEVLLESSRPITALALSPDEGRLAVAAYSMLAIYNLKSQEIEGVFTRVKGRITNIAWDPLARLVAFGTARGSIYVWNLRDQEAAGENNLKAVERYLGLKKPVAGLKFHPSGRALFAAERNGSVSVFRLLRTEFEMGLRDTEALIDQGKAFKRDGNTSASTSRLLGLDVQSDGKLMFGWGVEGGIDIWKVRGLRRQDRIQASTEAVQGVALMQIPKLGPILSTSSRDSHVRFWCRVPKKKRSLGLKKPVSEEEEAPAIKGFDASVDSRFLIETPQFKQPIDRLLANEASGLLWGTQKAGNLVVFDVRKLSSSLGACNR